MNALSIFLPLCLLLLLAEGVLLLWLALRVGRGDDTDSLRHTTARLYRYATDGGLPPPPRTARARQQMAESLFSLTRHLSLLSPSERERLGRRCSLTYHLVRRAERGGAFATADALQLLSVLPLSDDYAERIARLSPAEPLAQLYRLLILVCHSPDRVAEILSGSSLPAYLVPHLVARLEECRVEIPCRSLFATRQPLPLLVALRVVARYELADYEEEVFGALTLPSGEVRFAALTALAKLGATVDRRIVEATSAMSLDERRGVMRLFLREGYSARALHLLDEAEAAVGSPLANYAARRLSLRKRNLIKI
ncbi:MAG: hypothetical protein IKM50_05930 [Tidjanibacter sp.]|nr:hypothetical protein [Tidjanibacter sp.]